MLCNRRYSAEISSISRNHELDFKECQSVGDEKFQ
jgi:hypothetical protein